MTEIKKKKKVTHQKKEIHITTTEFEDGTVEIVTVQTNSVPCPDPTQCE